MKKLLIALAAVMITAASYGQGAIVFNTRIAGQVDAPVLLGGGPAGPGATFSAQLYQVNGTTLTPLSPITTFRPAGTGAASILDRYVQPVDVIIAGTPGGQTIQVKMVAWQTSLGATYDAARAASPNNGVGESAAISVLLGGAGPGGNLPGANLTGLAGFSIPVIPEPSTIALGLLGAAALLIRRRK